MSAAYWKKPMKLGQGHKHVHAIPAGADVMRQVDTLLTEALQYTRSLVAELSPPVLRDHGLAAALKWLGRYYMEKHEVNVAVKVSCAEEPALPEEQTALLFQSVRELLFNVSKHAGTDRANLTRKQHEGQLRIEVRDEGNGFDPATADGPAKDTSAGALLSKFWLFSIRERMKALGGSFHIESEPGRGTTCILILPLLSGPGHLGALAATANDRIGSNHVGRESGPVRVILVDDHAMMRQGLRSVLEAYPDVVVVAEASDGEAAVQTVAQFQPDVVVMDINMPRMNGIEATVRINQSHPRTVIIGLSVNADGENIEAMQRAGARLPLTKEAAVDQLYSAIERAVDKRSS